jgi:ABC-type glutathione transport system ATPase component
MNETLLEVDITVDYPGKPGALAGVRFEVRRGEIFGLVGESGSGKSTMALALLRLLDLRGGSARGSIRFAGRELMTCRERELRRLRGREIAFVPQSPVSALNPVLRLETHLREAWQAHRNESWREGLPHVRDLMGQMGLPPDAEFLRRYPHQVSVGQAQRILVTMAALHKPRLLIADEPTSALDPSSRGEILDLFGRLQSLWGVAILYISHDIASVAALADTAGVLDGGRLVECGPARTVFASPSHPATRRLMVAQLPRRATANWS